jgi:hypothetical protein
MQNRFLNSIGRFFAGTGHVIGTPSGDARGHVHMPNGSMYDAGAAERFVGR